MQIPTQQAGNLGQSLSPGTVRAPESGRIFLYPLEGTFTEVQRQPGLSREDVHLWFGSIDCLAESTSFWGILSPGEKDRAEGICSARLKNRFIASHGLLRWILGLYCGVDPCSLSFSHGPHGKPFLSEECSGEDIRFSTSDSGPHVVYAFAQGRDIGVDVEPVRAFSSMDGFVNRFFSDNERKEFRALEGDCPKRWFFDVWTGKEAYLKGTGEGLTRDPRGISIVRRLWTSSRIFILTEDEWKPAPWEIFHFEPKDGLAASLAIGMLHSMAQPL